MPAMYTLFEAGRTCAANCLVSQRIARRPVVSVVINVQSHRRMQMSPPVRQSCLNELGRSTRMTYAASKSPLCPNVEPTEDSVKLCGSASVYFRMIFDSCGTCLVECVSASLFDISNYADCTTHQISPNCRRPRSRSGNCSLVCEFSFLLTSVFVCSICARTAT